MAYFPDTEGGTCKEPRGAVGWEERRKTGGLRRNERE